MTTTAAFDDKTVRVQLMLRYQTAQLHDVLLLYQIIIHYYTLFTLQFQLSLVVP